MLKAESFVEPEDLGFFDIEELLQITIVSASKKEESYWSTPASVHVITQDEIIQSGALSVPQSLRLIPGTNVGQLTSMHWSISSRGFAGELSNKLLVMVNGRSIYSPAFSGVFWPAYHIPLEELKQIEVIHGPGGSIWGANAVNGIINIITKDAFDMQGTLVSLGGGTDLQLQSYMSRGVMLGEDAALAASVSYEHFDALKPVDDSASGGSHDWGSLRATVRYGRHLNHDAELDIESGAYLSSGSEDSGQQSLAPPYRTIISQDREMNGTYIRGSWTRELSPTSSLRLQAYFDHFDFTSQGHSDYTSNTFDFEFQHDWSGMDRHEISWGGGLRIIEDEMIGSFQMMFQPQNYDGHIASLFVQDRIELVPEKVFLTVGAKLEQNDYTDFEFQPTARVSWMPDDRNTLWASVSRAVRTPSRSSHDGLITISTFPAGPPEPPSFIPPTGALQFIGNPDLKSEQLMAYEAGYRTRIASKLLVNASAYFYHYDDLITIAPGLNSFTGVDMGSYTQYPMYFGNYIDGDTYGFEVGVDYHPSDNWTWRLNYAYIKMDLNSDTMGVVIDEPGLVARNTVGIQTSIDITPDWNLNLYGRHVGGHPAQGQKGYTELDARLAWQASDNCEVSLTGKNLLDNSHIEDVPRTSSTPYEVQRGVFAQVRWNF